MDRDYEDDADDRKMHLLQQRLELASVKNENGWQDLSMKEIENHLPPGPSKRRSLGPPSPVSPTHFSSPITSNKVYSPPSPSRPWQLIDVLWQPLPPPSHSRFPVSPSSPRKRNRDSPPYSPHTTPTNTNKNHRRSSSVMLHPISPLRPTRSEIPYGGISTNDTKGSKGQKKIRSQSQSHSTRRVSIQDVDAANALTSMLAASSVSTNTSPTPESQTQSRSSSQNQMISQPRRQTPNTTPRARIRRDRSINSVADEDIDDYPSFREDDDVNQVLENEEVGKDREEEDKTAAELMMFLAHSPSPMKKSSSTSMMTDRNGNGKVARVLFADRPEREEGRVKEHSNLVLAPPIFADTDERR
ncbi:hypothetical protein M231_01369 [Tremella mesenterica]|uniref:Uncharacterized protein n=1 Tax=Tremella mesenterica TaxID=5217 RepID=A0A4Q1BT37_TREME|nr:hypothetical protein M231_01369 [Tremella mesenterica]